MPNALVLAGGGVAGIAWELGVLRGIQETDAGLAARIVGADVVIGTSAGSAVAAQITAAPSWPTCAPPAEQHLAPLSPATRGPAARAGRQIGRARAAGVAPFWS